MSKISVIVPVYNPPLEMFKRCVNSLVTQTGDYEFIFVNDGSTDNWIEEYLSNLSKSENRILYINQHNKGVSAARNNGIASSKGEYIMFVDSDDIMLANSLDYSYSIIKKNNADIVLLGNINNKESNGKIHKTLNQSEVEDLIHGIIILDNKKFSEIGINVDAPWAKIFSKNLILKNSIKFNEKISRSEDAIFDMQCYLCANKILIDNTPVYSYESNPNSICSIYKLDYAKMLPEIIKAKEEITNRYFKDNIKFIKGISIRTFQGLMDSDYRLFSNSQSNLSITKSIKEFRGLINNKYIQEKIKNLKYSELKTFPEKVKLFMYKNDLIMFLIFTHRVFNKLK